MQITGIAIAINMTPKLVSLFLLICSDFVLMKPIRQSILIYEACGSLCGQVISGHRHAIYFTREQILEFESCVGICRNVVEEDGEDIDDDTDDGLQEVDYPIINPDKRWAWERGNKAPPRQSDAKSPIIDGKSGDTGIHGQPQLPGEPHSRDNNPHSQPIPPLSEGEPRGPGHSPSNGNLPTAKVPPSLSPGGGASQNPGQPPSTGLLPAKETNPPLSGKPPDEPPPTNTRTPTTPPAPGGAPPEGNGTSTSDSGQTSKNGTSAGDPNGATSATPVDLSSILQNTSFPPPLNETVAISSIITSTTDHSNTISPNSTNEGISSVSKEEILPSFLSGSATSTAGTSIFGSSTDAPSIIETPIVSTVMISTKSPWSTTERSVQQTETNVAGSTLETLLDPECLNNNMTDGNAQGSEQQLQNISKKCNRTTFPITSIASTTAIGISTEQGITGLPTGSTNFDPTGSTEQGITGLPTGSTNFDLTESTEQGSTGNFDPTGSTGLTATADSIDSSTTVSANSGSHPEQGGASGNGQSSTTPGPNVSNPQQPGGTSGHPGSNGQQPGQGSGSNPQHPGQGGASGNGQSSTIPRPNGSNPQQPGGTSGHPGGNSGGGNSGLSVKWGLPTLPPLSIQVPIPGLKPGSQPSGAPSPPSSTGGGTSGGGTSGLSVKWGLPTLPPLSIQVPIPGLKPGSQPSGAPSPPSSTGGGTTGGTSGPQPSSTGLSSTLQPAFVSTTDAWTQEPASSTDNPSSTDTISTPDAASATQEPTSTSTDNPTDTIFTSNAASTQEPASTDYPTSTDTISTTDASSQEPSTNNIPTSTQNILTTTDYVNSDPSQWIPNSEEVNSMERKTSVYPFSQLSEQLDADDSAQNVSMGYADIDKHPSLRIPSFNELINKSKDEGKMPSLESDSAETTTSLEKTLYFNDPTLSIDFKKNDKEWSESNKLASSQDTLVANNHVEDPSLFPFVSDNGKGIDEWKLWKHLNRDLYSSNQDSSSKLTGEELEVTTEQQTTTEETSTHKRPEDPSLEIPPIDFDPPPSTNESIANQFQINQEVLGNTLPPSLIPLTEVNYESHSTASGVSPTSSLSETDNNLNFSSEPYQTSPGHSASPAIEISSISTKSASSTEISTTAVTPAISTEISSVSPKPNQTPDECSDLGRHESDPSQDIPDLFQKCVRTTNTNQTSIESKDYNNLMEDENQLDGKSSNLKNLVLWDPSQQIPDLDELENSQTNDIQRTDMDTSQIGTSWLVEKDPAQLVPSLEQLQGNTEQEAEEADGNETFTENPMDPPLDTAAIDDVAPEEWKRLFGGRSIRDFEPDDDNPSSDLDDDNPSFRMPGNNKGPKRTDKKSVLSTDLSEQQLKMDDPSEQIPGQIPGQPQLETYTETWTQSDLEREEKVVENPSTVVLDPESVIEPPPFKNPEVENMQNSFSSEEGPSANTRAHPLGGMRSPFSQRKPGSANPPIPRTAPEPPPEPGNYSQIAPPKFNGTETTNNPTSKEPLNLSNVNPTTEPSANETANNTDIQAHSNLTVQQMSPVNKTASQKLKTTILFGGADEADDDNDDEM